jgi:hypothetical protein
MHTVLNGDEFGGFCVLVGVVCSSWVPINVGTSLRSYLDPLGDQTNAKVMLANTMVSRTGFAFQLVSFVYLKQVVLGSGLLVSNAMNMLCQVDSLLVVAMCRMIL